MKLTAINLARSIWLLYLQELNPKGLSLKPLLEPLVARYQFSKYPKPSDELNWPQGVRFQEGIWQNASNEPVAIGLTVYADGLVVESRHSTAVCDAVLEDVLTWASNEFNLTPYSQILRSKSYVSEVYVDTECSLDVINPRLREFGKRLNKEVIGQGEQVSFEIGSIAFWNDPKLTPGRVVSLTFERAQGFPFSKNRYFSASPLPTDKHLEKLAELESLLNAQ